MEPVAVPVRDDVPVQSRDAGWAARVAARAVDSFVVAVFPGATLAVGTVVVGISRGGATHSAGVVAGSSLVVVGVAAWLAYQVATTAHAGQTWGRRLLHIRVVDEATGGSPSWGQALAREQISLPALLFASLLFGVPGSFGARVGLVLAGLLAGAWALVDRRRRGLHDLVAGTRVVRAR